jgi:hypothetical protein
MEGPGSSAGIIIHGDTSRITTGGQEEDVMKCAEAVLH